MQASEQKGHFFSALDVIMTHPQDNDTTTTANTTDNGSLQDLGLVDFVNRPDVQPYIANAAAKLRSQRHQAMLSGYKGIAKALAKAVVMSPLTWWRWRGFKGFAKHIGLACLIVAVTLPVAVFIELIPFIAGGGTLFALSVFAAIGLLFLTGAKYLIKFLAR